MPYQELSRMSLLYLESRFSPLSRICTGQGQGLLGSALWKVLDATEPRLKMAKGVGQSRVSVCVCVCVKNIIS